MKWKGRNRPRSILKWFCCGLAISLLGHFALREGIAQAPQAAESYLSWTESQVDKIGKSMRVNGRVGGLFDFRIIHTEHAFNYKLRATWMVPEVIRATARLEQLRMRLTNDQTRELVAEAEDVADTVIMVEIDPREGSGVIPLDWRAVLQPIGVQAESIVGTSAPELKAYKALTGVVRRDYAYDVFWVMFPLVNGEGKPLIPEAAKQVELHVGIYNKQGKVQWTVPDSIRQRIKALSNTKK